MNKKDKTILFLLLGIVLSIIGWNLSLPLSTPFLIIGGLLIGYNAMELLKN